MASKSRMSRRGRVSLGGHVYLTKYGVYISVSQLITADAARFEIDPYLSIQELNISVFIPDFLLLTFVGNLGWIQKIPVTFVYSPLMQGHTGSILALLTYVDLGIFRVISAFCDTGVLQNAEIKQKNPSNTYAYWPYWHARVGNSRVHPRFRPTDVGWNLVWTRKFPTIDICSWLLNLKSKYHIERF